VDVPEPFARTEDGTFALELAPWVREVVRRLCDDLRELLINEHAAGDPAVARLFPAAYDDPLRNLDYERDAGNQLLASRLADLDTVQGTLANETLSEDELLAWLRTINDTRLVLGTRLDVTEESTFADFAGDEAATETFDLYHLLGELQAWMLAALDPELEDDPTWVEPPVQE
jgi:hypothetical protein